MTAKHDGHARSDARSVGVSDNGADDGVLKNTEQRLKERKGPELIDSRTAPPSKSRKGKNNDGQDGDPSSNKEPAVSEPHPNRVANLSPEANEVRNLVAELVRGNFVEHLEKKISEGRLRADLFQCWHEKFNHAEIEAIWELATRRVPISSMDPYSVRKAFVGLLNYDTSYVDDHELRGWIRVQKDAEKRKLRDTPTTYTRVGAQRLYAETVYEAADETIYANTVLPEKIDCFDIVTLQALNSWMEIDEERKERNKRAEDLLPDVDSRNIYFLINVALNPDQGVVFEPGYFANSQYFQGDETALFTTLQRLEDLRLVDIAKMDLESIETRPTPIERWYRSGATG